MKVFNDTTVEILGVRYPDGSGVPDMPEMRWKDGKADFSHLEK